MWFIRICCLLDMNPEVNNTFLSTFWVANYSYRVYQKYCPHVYQSIETYTPINITYLSKVTLSQVSVVFFAIKWIPFWVRLVRNNWNDFPSLSIILDTWSYQDSPTKTTTIKMRFGIFIRQIWTLWVSCCNLLSMWFIRFNVPF